MQRDFVPAAEQTVYKGRKRGTVEFYAIHKHDKAAKHRITNGVIDQYGDRGLDTVGVKSWVRCRW